MRAKRRAVPVGGVAHPNPLAAVARIDEGDRHIVPNRRTGGEMSVVVAVDVGVEPLDYILAVAT